MQNTAPSLNADLDPNIKPGDLYKHFKGDYYKIICVARDSNTTVPLVVYQGLYKSAEWGNKPIWTRALLDFIGYKEFGDGTKVPRFEKVSEVPKEYSKKGIQVGH